MIFSTLLLGFIPTVFFQEPEETKLEAAQRKVAELEAELGPEHLDIVQPLWALGRIYVQQAQIGKAERVSLRILAINEVALGPDHPEVAATLNNLASFTQRQGSYAEARPFHERGLSISLKHSSLNMRSMTEEERFRFLATQAGPEPLLINLIQMMGVEVASG